MDSSIVDITPDKSLMPKLGLNGHKFSEALAELIDNSIDARLGDKVSVSIEIDLKNSKITVKDDGKGMSKKGLASALTIAKESSDKRTLGKYGIGLKAACSHLGSEFTIKTMMQNDSYALQVVYKENDWLQTKDWSIKINEVQATSDLKHGTIIIIQELKVALYQYIIDKVLKNLGIRYASFIKTDMLELFVNGERCISQEPDLEGGKVVIDFNLPTAGHVHGWIGLQKFGSNIGDYGFDLFRNKRLIKQYDKLLIPHKEHPSISRIIGVLYLDEMPINFNKTDFDRDSAAFLEVETALKNDKEVMDVIRRSTKPKYSADIGSVAEERIKRYVNGFFSTINNEKVLHPPINEEQKPLLLAKKEIFFRGNSYIVEVILQPMSIPKVRVISQTDEGYKILINQAAPAFKLAKDKSFFVTQQVILGIAYVIAQSKNYDITSLEELENDLTYRGLEQITKSRIDSREREISIKPTISSNYLSNNLIEVEKILRQNFGLKSYYFTGTSVLESFLNHLPQRSYYLIYSTNDLINELQKTLIENFGDAFSILVDPTLNGSGKETRRIELTELPTIIIRPLERDPYYLKEGNIASFETALVDLYLEIKRNGFPVIVSDVIQIFVELYNAKLIKRNKLERYARRRGCLEDIEKIISGF